MSNSRRVSAILLPALLVPLAACGGGGGHDKTPEGAEAFAEEFNEAFLDGDADVCDMMTEALQEQMIEDWSAMDESADSCADVVKGASEMAKAFMSEDVLDSASYSAEVDGDTATVTVSYDAEDMSEETYGLIYEDGDWLADSEGTSE